MIMLFDCFARSTKQFVTATLPYYCFFERNAFCTAVVPERELSLLLVVSLLQLEYEYEHEYDL